MAKRAWMVRAGRDSIYFEGFLKDKVVGVFWLEDKELTKVKTKEEIKRLLKEWSSDWGDEKPNDNAINNWAGQIWRFIQEISIGDIVISYDNKNRQYILGTVVKGYEELYIEDFGYAHIHRVDNWKKIDRDKLSKNAQKSLRSILTVFEVTKYLPEFEALMRGEEYQPEEPEEEERLEASKEFETLRDQSFHMEKHLQDFLADNWDKTDLGRDWELYREDGQLLGKEYETGEIGRIDLLAQSKKGLGWLVVELKLGQTEDATIGQVLRYMGWVQENLADETVPVKGLIICQEDTPKLRYALKNANNVDLMLYEVNFTLKKPDKHG